MTRVDPEFEKLLEWRVPTSPKLDIGAVELDTKEYARCGNAFVEVPREAKCGIGGAPTRATTLPTDGAERKKFPVPSGFMDYFPDAIAAVSNLSYIGNEQHNPGEPLHWARGKSTDEADTMLRHFLQRGTVDTDGVRHSVKMAWRALALLQKEIEAEQPPANPDCGIPDRRKQPESISVTASDAVYPQRFAAYRFGAKQK